jgi:hypothetical protein
LNWEYSSSSNKIFFSLTDEVTYTLSGAAAKGSFYMDGEYKSTIALNGVNLTNPDSAAICIDNGKRINVVLTDGTSNTLVDGVGGTQKACFFINGHAEFKGSGAPNLIDEPVELLNYV